MVPEHVKQKARDMLARELVRTDKAIVRLEKDLEKRQRNKNLAGNDILASMLEALRSRRDAMDKHLMKP